MKRHAQRYWLERQAKDAVNVACRIESPTVESEVMRQIEYIDDVLPNASIEMLNLRREEAIVDASQLLHRAEVFHREIARRGGEVNK